MPKFDFIFRICNDISAMREFYCEFLALKYKNYNEKDGYLVLDLGEITMVFNVESGKAPIHEEFTRQPGHNLGSLELTSFGIKYEIEEFKELIIRLAGQSHKIMTDVPIWRQESYWAITILDPEGTSIELYAPIKNNQISEWNNFVNER